MDRITNLEKKYIEKLTRQAGFFDTFNTTAPTVEAQVLLLCST